MSSSLALVVSVLAIELLQELEVCGASIDVEAAIVCSVHRTPQRKRHQAGKADDACAARDVDGCAPDACLVVVFRKEERRLFECSGLQYGISVILLSGIGRMNDPLRSPTTSRRFCMKSYGDRARGIYRRNREVPALCRRFRASSVSRSEYQWQSTPRGGVWCCTPRQVRSVASTPAAASVSALCANCR